MNGGPRNCTRRPGAQFVNLRAEAWVRTLDAPTGLALALLHTIARHTDEFGCSWCKRRTLAKETGCSVRTVSTHLQTLEALNHIRRVGRLGDHGGRVSSVLVLKGWPGRKLIPPAGHPLLGNNIKEDKYDALERAYLRQRRKTFPEARENSALQNNIPEKHTTTDAEKTRLLDVVFEALGRWATEENREYLRRDVGTLVGLIEGGHDLEHTILPVLREKATMAPDIPTLRTWRYFLMAIRARAARTQNRNCSSAISARSGQDTHYIARTDHSPHDPNRERELTTGRVLAGCVKNFSTKPIQGN